MVGLTFPVYVTSSRHYDILIDFLQSVRSSEQLYKFAVLNFVSDEYEQRVIECLNTFGCLRVDNIFGNSVSGAWNVGIRQCFSVGCEFVIVSNVDVLLQDTCIDNLVTFWRRNPTQYGIWCARPLANMDELSRTHPEDKVIETGLYSMFAVSTYSISKLTNLEKEGRELYPGLFDTNFTPAYFEDNDYDRRLYLANMKPATTYSAIYWHLGSQTIRNDKKLESTTSASFEKNRKYFNIKWNAIVKGSPDPFNDGGFVGAFGGAGHLIGHYANAYRNLPRVRHDEIVKMFQDPSVHEVDGFLFDANETFVAMHTAIQYPDKSIIFNPNLQYNGAFSCALKEFTLARGS